MGKLGKEIEKAYKIAAPVMGGLAIMITRKHGSKAMILAYADQLEKAANQLREAVGKL